MSLGKPAWTEARQVLQKLLSSDEVSGYYQYQVHFFLSLSLSLCLSSLLSETTVILGSGKVDTSDKPKLLCGTYFTCPGVW